MPAGIAAGLRDDDPAAPAHLLEGAGRSRRYSPRQDPCSSPPATSARRCSAAALDSHAAHLALQLLALAAGALIALAVRLAPAPRRAWVATVPLGAAGDRCQHGAPAGGELVRRDRRTWRADALADQRDAGTLVLIVVALAALLLGGAALRARRRG